MNTSISLALRGACLLCSLTLLMGCATVGSPSAAARNDPSDDLHAVAVKMRDDQGDRRTMPPDLPPASIFAATGTTTETGADRGLVKRTEEFGLMCWDDTRQVLSSPARWDRSDWMDFGIDAAVVAGAALALDRPVSDYFEKYHNDSIDQQVERFGSEYSFAVLGGFYLGGLATGDANAKEVTGDGLASSLIAGGIIVPALKLAVGRSRPSADQGTFDLHPFSGKASFPSGHTTQAFAVATVISEHYDRLWIKTVSYGLAALVGAARMDHQQHFFSDVVAGGIIGTSVGRAVVHINRGNSRGITLVPVINENMCGVGAALPF